MGTSLKILLRCFIALLFLVLLSACGKNGKIYEGVSQGMYNASNQVQQMKNLNTSPSQENEPLTYEQYKRERQEMLQGKESSRAQQ